MTPHALYQSLGEDDGARRAAYLQTFPQALEPATLEMLRQATNGGRAIGSDRFRAQIEALTARRAAPRPKGRKSGDGK